MNNENLTQEVKDSWESDLVLSKNARFAMQDAVAFYIIAMDVWTHLKAVVLKNCTGCELKHENQLGHTKKIQLYC